MQACSAVCLILARTLIPLSADFNTGSVKENNLQAGSVCLANRSIARLNNTASGVILTFEMRTVYSSAVFLCRFLRLFAIAFQNKSLDYE